MHRDGLSHLLFEVRDKADSARNEPESSANAPLKSELGGDRRDRACRVDGKVPLRLSLSLCRDQLDQSNIWTGDALLLGKFEQPKYPRICDPMYRVSDPWHELALIQERLHDASSGTNGWARPLEPLLKHPRCILDGSDETTSHAEKTGDDGALQGFGRSEIRQTRRERARRQAVIDERHEDRVEESRLLGCR